MRRSGHGEQDTQHAERDLLWQDEGRREQPEVGDTGVRAEAAAHAHDRPEVGTERPAAAAAGRLTTSSRLTDGPAAHCM